jgi:hypothetical protein
VLTAVEDLQGEGIPLHGEFYTRAGGGLLSVLTRALGAHAMTDLNNANRKMDRSLTLVIVRFTKLLFVVVVAQSDSGRLPGKRL